MRSAAKIGEIALLIERNHAVLGKVFDELNFIRLFVLFHQSDCLFSRKLESFDCEIGFDYLLHFFLDFGKIVYRDRRFEIYIIIKSRVDRRTDRKRTCGVNRFDCLRENVRTGVTINIESFGILGSYDNDFRILFDGIRKIDELTVNLARYRVSSKPFAYRGSNARNGCRPREFENFSVCKSDFHFVSPLPYSA